MMVPRLRKEDAMVECTIRLDSPTNRRMETPWTQTFYAFP
jgi:hypothetical protein